MAEIGPGAPPHPSVGAVVALVAVTLAILGALMFAAAGTIAWPRGRLFLAVYGALTAAACAWLWRTNPEIFAARSRIQKGTKPWDRALTAAIVASWVAILIVSALDDARFGWARPPDWVVALGYALFAPGFLGFAWAQSVNPHFEATVRIQTDRGHSVVSTGPYAIVRHPGYAFAIPMVLGMPLAMGSLWGLVPAGMLVGLIAVRTFAEDATLKAELPGYADYAARVRWRWLPGVF
ncbi:MAG TPA: isoprenylcysteine carboxylmethyltransferase family protein [Candidatus Binatia bacterium]|nr:isoprenylcysteine carboxylmethyltransferase family protein [Candidatus Binatia bacterium]